jgi:lipoprotein-releasing system ATP-binding protein
MSEVLRLEGVEKRYGQGSEEVTVLAGVDFALSRGESVALVAPSGAGKSTLLHIAGLLDSPSAGRVAIDGKPAEGLAEGERTRMRRDLVGFVYQFHHLLPEFSALENVAMPLRAAGRGRAEAEARARSLLEVVGLGHRLTHRPAELSGGEQQRVAFARALANRPALLLADEPTGNLDPDTSERVFGVLMDLVRGEGLAALVATHNPDLAARMGRILRLDHGRLVEAAA